MSNGGYSELIKRVKPGRPAIFETPEDLWEMACNYFTWQDQQSMDEDKGVGFQGVYEIQKIEHALPYTIQALTLYCNISDSTWHDYRKKPSFIGVTKEIEKTIYSQKFQGASTGRFNANIIARDLGLKDKTDITSNDETISTNEVTDLELARKIAFGLRAAKESMDKTPEDGD